jgi:hypothetical protein
MIKVGPIRCPPARDRPRHHSAWEDLPALKSAQKEPNKEGVSFKSSITLQALPPGSRRFDPSHCEKEIPPK